MKNKIGFIPKSFPIQPDYYKECFGNWNAVFLTYSGKEYHIELQSDFFNRNDADKIEILKQEKDCRRQVFVQQFTSITQSYKSLLPILERENKLPDIPLYLQNDKMLQ